MSRDTTERIAAPDPDAASKPDSPTEITKPSWKYIARRTVREFSKDQCTDLAASLTYYSVLALFPAAIAILSLIGLFGQSDEALAVVTDILRQVAGDSAVDTLSPTLEQLSQGTGAGFALVIGIAAALWSASGYVGSFGRAMNSIHGIDEGRPFYKLRPTMLAITAITVVLTSAVALTLVVSGPLAQAIGDVIGLGSTAVLVWSIAKWPAVLAVVVLIVALLYYATPNIKQPKFRWISIGATFAILIWIIASAGFGVYVANFSNYDKTYGSLAGVIVFLLWLWITNIALLFGAELDAELERGRQLQAGLPAEETLQLPPRDTTTFEKSRQQHAEDIEEGRRLRLTHGTSTSEQDCQDEQDGVTMGRTEKKTGTSAKILYRPVGLISSIVAGIVAGQVFKQVWKRATPGDQSDAPQPLESEYNLRQVLIAATVQGAIFAAVKALVDRGGATVFEKWTGEWPGD